MIKIWYQKIIWGQRKEWDVLEDGSLGQKTKMELWEAGTYKEPEIEDYLQLTFIFNNYLITKWIRLLLFKASLGFHPWQICFWEWGAS